MDKAPEYHCLQKYVYENSLYQKGDVLVMVSIIFMPQVLWATKCNADFM